MALQEANFGVTFILPDCTMATAGLIGGAATGITGTGEVVFTVEAVVVATGEVGLDVTLLLFFLILRS